MIYLKVLVMLNNLDLFNFYPSLITWRSANVVKTFVHIAKHLLIFIIKRVIV